MNVLITGSSKGLGRSLALKFASEGHDIVLHGRNQEDLDRVKAIVLEKGSSCDVVRGDIILDKTLNRLNEVARKRDIDILINNAATYIGKLIENMTPEEIRAVIETNLVAPMLLTMIILPVFLEKGRGTIININSIATKHPNELEAAYRASKFGLKGFTEVLGIEAIRRNVRVVSVSLGAMENKMTGSREGCDGRINPDEAADTIFSVCMDRSSMFVSEIEIRRRVHL